MSKVLGTLWSFISFPLILICIGGLAMRTFADDGWAEQLIGIVWEAEVRSPLIMTPVIGGALYLISVFLRGGLKLTNNATFGDLLAVLLSLGGIYFTWEWIRHAA